MTVLLVGTSVGVSVAARTYGYAQLAENVERLIKAIQAHHIRGSIQ